MFSCISILSANSEVVLVHLVKTCFSDAKYIYNFKNRSAYMPHIMFNNNIIIYLYVFPQSINTSTIITRSDNTIPQSLVTLISKIFCMKQEVPRKEKMNIIRLFTTKNVFIYFSNIRCHHCFLVQLPFVIFITIKNLIKIEIKILSLR